MEYVKLNNGVEMPILGFGVYQIPASDTKKCVMDAIKALDTSDSLFFNHQDPNMVELFDKMVYERRDK